MDNSKIEIAGSIYSEMPLDLQRKVYNAGFLDMDHRNTKPKASTLKDRASILGSSPGIFVASEWQLTGAEYRSVRTSCICGQSGLKHRYILTNKITGNKISVGGNCLTDHFGQEPKQELIDFSRDVGSSQYLWLGQKYDAFIFFSLGFKKATAYYRMRQLHQAVPIEYNMKLQKDLGISLYVFSFKKWQTRLERGNRLLRHLRKMAIAKQYSSAENKRTTSFTIPKDPIATFTIPPPGKPSILMEG